MPQGPTLLGPLRSWIQAAIFRSARVVIATASSQTVKTINVFAAAEITNAVVERDPIVDSGQR
jgi:hypothetical protein